MELEQAIQSAQYKQDKWFDVELRADYFTTLEHGSLKEGFPVKFRIRDKEYCIPSKEYKDNKEIKTYTGPWFVRVIVGKDLGGRTQLLIKFGGMMSWTWYELPLDVVQIRC